MLVTVLGMMTFIRLVQTANVEPPTLAMLLGPDRGGAYLRELGLPHLCIEDDGNVSGDITLAA